jgi:hypothetical protein
MTLGVGTLYGPAVDTCNSSIGSGTHKQEQQRLYLFDSREAQHSTRLQGRHSDAVDTR